CRPCRRRRAQIQGSRLCLAGPPQAGVLCACAAPSCRSFAYSAASRVPLTFLGLPFAVLPFAVLLFVVWPLAVLAFAGGLALAVFLRVPLAVGSAVATAASAPALPLALPVLRRPLGLLGPLARRSAISSTASLRLSAAGSLARGRVALTSPCLT